MSIKVERGGIDMTDTLLLKKILFQIQDATPNCVLQDAELSAYKDVLLERIVANLSFFLLGKVVSEETTIDSYYKIPVGWLDSLKIKIFPGWLLHKFPPRFRSIPMTRVVKHYHICPHINVAVHKDERDVHFRFLKGQETQSKEEIDADS